MPVSVLVESEIRFSWQQAVALVQAIVAVRAGRPRPARGSESLADLALDRDGVVVAVSDSDPPLSVSEVALLLGRLLPGEATAQKDRTPAGIQFAISRALGLAPAPSFGGVEEFSQLLARFEAPNRSELLREVFEHYVAHASSGPASRAEQSRVAASRQSASGPQAMSSEQLLVLERRSRVERRRSWITPDVARRLLRDADERHYRATTRRGPGMPPGRERAANVPVDMLRRFLRDADRTAFEAARSAPNRAAEVARDSWGVTPRSYVAFTLLAIVVAICAIADLYLRAPAPAPIGTSYPARDASPQSAGRGVTPLGSASRFQGAAAAAVDGSQIAPGGAPAGRAGREMAPGGGRNAPPTGPRRATARRPTSPVPVIAKRSQTAATPAKSIEAKQSRRSAPIRFFGAVRRGFLRLVHRQPTTTRGDVVGRPTVQ